VQNLAVKALPDAINGTPVDPDEFIEMDSQSRNDGRGAVNRAEEIRMNVAAVVTQTLPNGNLVIHGRQEVRVNFEMREVIVAGIIRPEDITPKNTIPHEKIAELRVAYGGRSQITDVQQPRYGA
jgi:flagellar L-ring protein precursor FlgH